MTARATIGVLIALALVLPSSPARAWGATGHRLVSSLAAALLPEDIPGFLRGADVAWQIGELGREPDRSKGSGVVHDRERDPGHYVNIGDDFLIAGGPLLMALPDTRGAYDSALRQRGTDQYEYGR